MVEQQVVISGSLLSYNRWFSDRWLPIKSKRWHEASSHIVYYGYDTILHVTGFSFEYNRIINSKKEIEQLVITCVYNEIAQYKGKSGFRVQYLSMNEVLKSRKYMTLPTGHQEMEFYIGESKSLNLSSMDNAKHWMSLLRPRNKNKINNNQKNIVNNIPIAIATDVTELYIPSAPLPPPPSQPQQQEQQILLQPPQIPTREQEEQEEERKVIEQEEQESTVIKMQSTADSESIGKLAEEDEPFVKTKI